MIGGRVRTAAIVLSAVGAFWCAGQLLGGIYSPDRPVTTLTLALFASAFLLPIPTGIAFMIIRGGIWAVGRRTTPVMARLAALRDAQSEYAAQRKLYLAHQRRLSEAFWRSLSGTQFEKELAALFVKHGYAATLTPATGDGGVDIVLRKDGRTTVVQCKAHSRKVPVGVARELAASMRDFNADAAIIACLEGVTGPTRAYMQDKPMSVVALPEIIDMQSAAERR